MAMGTTERVLSPMLSTEHTIVYEGTLSPSFLPHASVKNPCLRHRHPRKARTTHVLQSLQQSDDNQADANTTNNNNKNDYEPTFSFHLPSISIYCPRVVLPLFPVSTYTTSQSIPPAITLSMRRHQPHYPVNPVQGKDSPPASRTTVSIVFGEGTGTRLVLRRKAQKPFLLHEQHAFQTIPANARSSSPDLVTKSLCGHPWRTQHIRQPGGGEIA